MSFIYISSHFSAERVNFADDNPFRVPTDGLHGINATISRLIVKTSVLALARGCEGSLNTGMPGADDNHVVFASYPMVFLPFIYLNKIVKRADQLSFRGRHHR